MRSCPTRFPVAAVRFLMCLTSEIDFDMNDGKLVFEFLMNSMSKNEIASVCWTSVKSSLFELHIKYFDGLDSAVRTVVNSIWHLLCYFAKLSYVVERRDRKKTELENLFPVFLLILWERDL